VCGIGRVRQLLIDFEFSAFEEPQRIGHPENLSHFLGIDVLKWYHPSAFVRHQENTRKAVPPAKINPKTMRSTKTYTGLRIRFFKIEGKI